MLIVSGFAKKRGPDLKGPKPTFQAVNALPFLSHYLVGFTRIFMKGGKLILWRYCGANNDIS